MKVTDEPGGRISLDQDSTRMAGWILALGIFLFCLGYYQYQFRTHNAENLQGGIGAFVTCALIFLVMYEKTSFLIDPQTGFVRWSRRRIFRSKEGMIPFTEVRSVLVQTPIGDTGVPSRRIALILHDGKEIPITTAYMPDGNDECPALAERIRHAIGMPATENEPDAEISALLREGRKIEAIKALRNRTGMSLKEAHDRIDSIRKKP